MKTKEQLIAFIERQKTAFIPVGNESKSCLHDLDECRMPRGSISRPLGRFKFDAPLPAAGYLTASVDEEGFPNIKAMYAPRKIEGDSFYFSTNTSSMRSKQFMENPKASIYFYRRGRYYINFKSESFAVCGLPSM